MKKFKGSINFVSVPDQDGDHGTTFTFTMKLESEANSHDKMQSQKGEVNKFEINSKHFFFDWNLSSVDEYLH